MPKRLKVHGLDPDSNPDGKFVGLSGGKPAWLDPSLSGGLPTLDIVTDFGAAVDGATDDTAAWQAALDAAGAAGGARIISSRSGVSIIAGALQDTGGANAQLLLPAIDDADSEQISISIEGATPAPSGYSVVGTTPLPDNHLVLKSTLTSGSGGNLLGGYGPVGTFAHFTFVMLRLANIAFRMPANPTHSALDLSHLTAADLDNVVIDAGSYYIGGLATPTTSTSYALKLPANNNGAYTRMGAVSVIGFYNGILIGEHTTGEMVQAGGCKRAFVFPGVYHASKFLRLCAQHCQNGMVFTGAAAGGDPNEHYVDVDQFDVEHATTGWWAPGYDIDDASNYAHGFVRHHTVLAGTGVVTTFLMNGGSGIQESRVGATIGGSSLTVKDEGSTLTSAVTSIDVTGAGAAATNVGGAVTVNIPGGTGSELLMQDGVTAPPVPIETEAQDDWLYAD